MKKRMILSLLLGLLLSQNIFADSPLTTTDFSKAYEDTQIVQEASKTNGILNEPLMKYLIKSKNPIDLKIAVINKIGWDYNGKNNAELFADYLKEHHITDIRKANADILICYAYLKALDNYFDVEEALSYAKFARLKDQKSYTIAIICAIIDAQIALDYDWCKVYNQTNYVRVNTGLDQDMREEAIQIIFKYMDAYKKYCD